MKWYFGDNLRSCLCISAIIAIPSLAYTFYLPALPGMAKSLGVSPSMAKLSMTFLMVTAMVSLLVVGPLSDRFGRKPVLLVGLVVNIIACLALSQTSSLQMLLISKGIQGVGLATCFAVAYPMIRDVIEGPGAMRMMAMAAAVNIGASVAGPTLGAHVYEHFGWPMQFYIEAGYSVLLILLFVPFLPETLPVERRRKHGQWFSQYIGLLKKYENRKLLLKGAVVNGAFSVYLTSSAFLYMHYFGLSTVMFGYLYGAKCLLQFLASIATGKLVEVLFLTESHGAELYLSLDVRNVAARLCISLA